MFIQVNDNGIFEFGFVKLIFSILFILRMFCFVGTSSLSVIAPPIMSIDPASNVCEIRSKMHHVMNDIRKQIDTYEKWLLEKEKDFERRVILREIKVNVNLFRKLEKTIVQIKNSKKLSWYDIVQNLYCEILDNVHKHHAIGCDIKARSELGKIQTQISTFEGNSWKRIKQQITTSNVINRHNNKSKTIESKLRKNLIQFKFEIDSFNSGMIRYKKKTINLKDVATIIESLSENESPLQRAYSDLAKRKSSVRTHTQTSTSAEIITIIDDNEQQQPFTETLSPNKPLTREVALARLNIIANSKLYTMYARDEIETVIKSIKAAFPDDSEINNQITTIRSNLPITVINQLEENAKKPSEVWATKIRVKALIENLHRDDVFVKVSLERLLKQLNDMI